MSCYYPEGDGDIQLSHWGCANIPVPRPYLNLMGAAPKKATDVAIVKYPVPRHKANGHRAQPTGGDPGGRGTSKEHKSTGSGRPTCHKVSPATSGFYQAWMAARLQRLAFSRSCKPSVRLVPPCLLCIHFRDEEALR